MTIHIGVRDEGVIYSIVLLRYIDKMRLYYHKTDGGAEYLCSNNLEGSDEGSFDSQYIVRIDGNIEKDAELMINENK